MKSLPAWIMRITFCALFNLLQIILTPLAVKFGLGEVLKLMLGVFIALPIMGVMHLILLMTRASLRDHLYLLLFIPDMIPVINAVPFAFLGQMFNAMERPLGVLGQWMRNRKSRSTANDNNDVAIVHTESAYA